MKNNEFQYETGFVRGFEAAQPKWISVEDDLPANVVGPYLVYAYHYISVADWSYDKWTGRWWFYVDGEHEPGVTHWMLLPPAPNDNKEEQS